jgi:hypothetical protein
MTRFYSNNMQFNTKKTKKEMDLNVEILTAWLDKRNIKPEKQQMPDGQRYFTQTDWNKIFAYLASLQFKEQDLDGYLRLMKRWDEYYAKVKELPEYEIMMALRDAIKSNNTERAKRLHLEIKVRIKTNQITQIPTPSSYDPVLLAGSSAVTDYFRIRSKLKSMTNFSGTGDDLATKAGEIFNS